MCAIFSVMLRANVQEKKTFFNACYFTWKSCFNTKMFELCVSLKITYTTAPLPARRKQHKKIFFYGHFLIFLFAPYQKREESLKTGKYYSTHLSIIYNIFRSRSKRKWKPINILFFSPFLYSNPQQDSKREREAIKNDLLKIEGHLKHRLHPISLSFSFRLSVRERIIFNAFPISLLSLSHCYEGIHVCFGMMLIRFICKIIFSSFFLFSFFTSMCTMQMNRLTFIYENLIYSLLSLFLKTWNIGEIHRNLNNDENN